MVFATPNVDSWVNGGESLGINVRGQVIGEVGEDIVTYRVDIEWGDMKFVYDFGMDGNWDPELLEYTGGSGVAGWLVDGFLNDPQGAEIGNNEIRVTNRSNAAVTVELGFMMNIGLMGGLSSVFNDVEQPSNAWNFAVGTTNSAAMGGFYLTAARARDAAEIHDTRTVINSGGNQWRVNQNLTALQSGGAVIILPPASLPEYIQFASNNPSSPVHADLTGSRFFAFSGAPDSGRSAILDEFSQVGRISVSVSPTEWP